MIPKMTGAHVFFVNLEPVIDHVAPVAYTLARTDPRRVMIVCLNPLYDIAKDYRLRFLLRDAGVRSFYVDEIHLPLFLKHRLWRMYLCLPRTLLRRRRRKEWQHLFNACVDLTARQARGLIKSLSPLSVTVDDGMPLSSVDAISRATHAFQVPLVQLQNGLQMTRVSPQPFADFSLHDYSLIPHRLLDSRRDDNNRLRALGSPRYCAQWQEILSKELWEQYPDAVLPQEENKLKVLILEKGPEGFIEEHPTIRCLMRLDFAQVIFKKKPRVTMPTKLFGVGFDSFPTNRLILWADVVICLSTSVVMDVFHHGKILLCPKYVYPYERGLFEDYQIGWVVHSLEELLEALKRIHENRHIELYARERVKDFYKAVVCNSEPEADILERYADFYSSITRGPMGLRQEVNQVCST